MPRHAAKLWLDYKCVCKTRRSMERFAERDSSESSHALATGCCTDLAKTLTLQHDFIQLLIAFCRDISSMQHAMTHHMQATCAGCK